jgi:hypothetical protein
MHRQAGVGAPGAVHPIIVIRKDVKLPLLLLFSSASFSIADKNLVLILTGQGHLTRQKAE